MCDYIHNSDAPRYRSTLDVFIPLTAQFYVVVKEGKKMDFFTYKKDHVYKRLLLQNEFTIYIHMAFLLLDFFNAFFSNE